jgi:hypothetical protein
MFLVFSFYLFSIDLYRPLKGFMSAHRLPAPSKLTTDPFNKKDLAGYQHSKDSILVLRDSGDTNKIGQVLWECVCGCGRTKLLTSSKILRGQKSCGECKDIERERILKRKYKYLIEKRVLRSIDSISDSQRYSILMSFLEGSSVPELELTWNLKRKSVRPYLNSIRDMLSVALALDHNMGKVNTTKGSPESINVEAVIKNVIRGNSNTQLDSFLSGPKTKNLTAQEVTFGYIYNATGSINLALKESEFESVLTSTTSPAIKQTLGMYLLSKPNIKSFINSLVKTQQKSLEISKPFVQNELVVQIIQLKEKLALETTAKQADRGYLLKAIELLGKTVGGFTDRIQIEEVDPSKALDKLIEMVNEDVESTYKIEDVEEEE